MTEYRCLRCNVYGRVPLCEDDDPSCWMCGEKDKLIVAMIPKPPSGYAASPNYDEAEAEAS